VHHRRNARLRRKNRAAQAKAHPDGMKLIRTHEIRLKWTGEKVIVFAEAEGERVEAFGPDVPAALEALAERIRIEGVKLRAPAWAQQYRDGETLKAVCPECGYITTMSDFASVIAYICEGCGAGVDVEPFVDS